MGIRQYKVIITPTAYREMNRIYEYITEDLYAENAAKDLMEIVENKIQRLKYSPKIHTEINKIDELERNYRKIIIKNYIILYTINEENKTVFIAHMYYSGINYIDKN